jgi:uncharacterized membrane protein YqjE
MTSPQDHLLERLKKLPAEIRLLIEKRVELYVIEFGDSVSKNASKAIAGIISGLVFLLALVFALFALAFFVGDILDSTAAGFAVVAALLLVIGLVVYLLSPDLIETRFRDSIAAAFLGATKGDSGQESLMKQLPKPKDADTDSDTYSQHTIKNIKPN